MCRIWTWYLGFFKTKNDENVDNDFYGANFYDMVWVIVSISGFN